MESVFITGGSRGIGAACVAEMVKRGWKVTFTYRESYEQAMELSEKLKAYSNVVPVQADVRDRESVARGISEGKERLGISGFDGLITSAGVSFIEPFDLSKGEHWEKMMATNVDGSANAIWELMPFMLSQKRGSIVLLSSIWGQAGSSCEVAYSASKGAVDSMTRALAKELGPSGVRVNAVSPGLIDTEMNSCLAHEDCRAFTESIPLGRMGKPEEVAKVVAFLMSEESSYITGQVVGVSGGV